MPINLQSEPKYKVARHLEAILGFECQMPFSHLLVVATATAGCDDDDRNNRHWVEFSVHCM